MADPVERVRRESCLHGQISKTLAFLIYRNCFQAALDSQGEEEAEGSWHSVSRKWGLSTLGSLNERGCSGSKKDES